MHWLSAWLKTIIVIILIAAFVDLLLPSNKMQRYVKTVLSLFILLTLLSPILELLRGDWNFDKLFAEAVREQTAVPVSGRSRGQLDAQEIARNGERLKQTGDKQATQLAEEQIARGIKEDISRETAYDAVQVWVKTAQDGEGRPFITGVEAILKERKAAVGAEAQKAGQQAAGNADASKNFASMKPIDPVKPVEIDIRAGNSKAAGGEAGQSAETEAQRKAKDAAVQLLMRNWGVSPDNVVIRFATGMETKS